MKKKKTHGEREDKGDRMGEEKMRGVREIKGGDKGERKRDGDMALIKILRKESQTGNSTEV